MLEATVANSDAQPPAILLILLDALDEADDSSLGWGPVARLVAEE